MVEPAITYVTDEGGKYTLCVNEDGGRGTCHRFPLDYTGIARLQAESGTILLSIIQRFGLETFQAVN